MFMGQGERLHQVTEEDHLLNELKVDMGGEGRESQVIGQWDLALGSSKHISGWKQMYFELHSWGDDEDISGCL